MEGLKDEINIIFRPAARQYTKQITLHENETIGLHYIIYTI